MNIWHFQEYQYSIGPDFEVSAREKSKTSLEKQNPAPSVDPESFATFKITAAGNEQKSRDALTLPYERFDFWNFSFFVDLLRF